MVLNLTASNIWTSATTSFLGGKVVHTINNLGNTYSQGIILQNTATTSVVNALQLSPSLRFAGQAYATGQPQNYFNTADIYLTSNSNGTALLNFDVSGGYTSSAGRITNTPLQLISFDNSYWANAVGGLAVGSPAVPQYTSAGIAYVQSSLIIRNSGSILYEAGPNGQVNHFFQTTTPITATATVNAFMILQPTYTTTGGTQGNNDFIIERTENNVGTGPQRMISTGILVTASSYVENFGVDNKGTVISTMNNLAAGVTAGLILQNNTLSSGPIPFQNAPVIYFSGHGSQSGADKQIIQRIRSASQDINGGNQGNFIVDNSIDGGVTYQNLFAISRQNGNLVVGANGNGAVYGSGIIYANGAGGSGTLYVQGIYSGASGFLSGGFFTATLISLGGTNQNTSVLTQNYVNANVYTKYNQASGGASNYDFIVTRSGTVGSGRQILISAGPSTTTGTYSEVFAVDTSGKINQPYGGTRPVIGTVSLSSGIANVLTGAVSNISIIYYQYYNTSSISIGIGSLSTQFVTSGITASTGFSVNALTLTGSINTTDNSIIQWYIFN